MIHLVASRLAGWMEGREAGCPRNTACGLLQSPGLWDPGHQALWVAGPCMPRRSQRAMMGVRRSGHQASNDFNNLGKSGKERGSREKDEGLCVRIVSPADYKVIPSILPKQFYFNHKSLAL